MKTVSATIRSNTAEPTLVTPAFYVRIRLCSIAMEIVWRTADSSARSDVYALALVFKVFLY